MNCFAHAFPFLDRNDHFAIGCAIPDWLGAVDRKCRVRRNSAAEFASAQDPLVSSLAAGIRQHIEDDRWFHSGRKFTDLNMAFALEIREQLAGEPGFRPGFLGHIMIELLLDAFLHESNPGRLQEFYDLVAGCDPESVQSAINSMATRPTAKLAGYFSIFLRERYLFDYSDDRRLMFRIDHVMRRVKLNPVQGELRDWVPTARQRVYESAPELLDEFAVSIVSV